MSAKRVALITSSTSGIGIAIAFHSRSSTDKGKELADSYPDSSYAQAD